MTAKENKMSLSKEHRGSGLSKEHRILKVKSKSMPDRAKMSPEERFKYEEKVMNTKGLTDYFTPGMSSNLKVMGSILYFNKVLSQLFKKHGLPSPSSKGGAKGRETTFKKNRLLLMLVDELTEKVGQGRRGSAYVERVCSKLKEKEEAERAKAKVKKMTAILLRKS